ncbi:hypothetical protein N657DRAFT_19948 [Parathielavia appendiculata]|uniref:HMG box domain-containing protein n=1 Tax=Parathielavia appendiculata TaxID=2587402 RepID=A0AAN6U8V8_9PEZI|nr:hypothetical protein N657DRAFT_19948 [Parathielavia appendiculata]
MWSAIGRATAQQVRIGGRLWVRSTSRLAAKLPARVAPIIPSGVRVAAVFSRGFAEAGRPKKTSKAATSKVAKKAAAKKPATKKKTATKKPARKAKKAPAAKKAKPVKAKKPLTEEEKVKREIRALKKTGLLKEEPARLPENPWLVYSSQRVKKAYLELGPDLNLPDVMAGLASDYKALSTAEMEELRAVCAQNKIANKTALRNWLDNYTPQQIHEANLARKQLRRKHKIQTRPTFDDPRYPSRPLNSYAAFVKSRFHVSGINDPTSAKSTLLRIASEWKQLGAEERKAFEEIAKTDSDRFAKEMEPYRK